VGLAGLAQLTGPDSALKGLGRSRPNRSAFLVRARPGPDSRAGPESVWLTKHQDWARTSLT